MKTYEQFLEELDKPFKDVTDRIAKQGTVNKGTQDVSRGHSGAMDAAIKQRQAETYKKPQQDAAKRAMQARERQQRLRAKPFRK